jgi:hypothetical protein
MRSKHLPEGTVEVHRWQGGESHRQRINWRVYGTVSLPKQPAGMHRSYAFPAEQHQVSVKRGILVGNSYLAHL